MADKKNILLIGQTCWDRIIWPNGNRVERIGGSIYYIAKAVEYVAKKTMHCPTQITVWASVGKNDSSKMRNLLRSTNIKPYFIKQENTLQFQNKYLDKKKWTKRQQSVLVPPVPLTVEQAPKKLKKGKMAYDFILLLPLTPTDFCDIRNKFIPFLKKSWPGVPIGIALQGLLRKVNNDKVVSPHLSNDHITFIKDREVQKILCCAHLNIDEGEFLVKQLTPLDRICDLDKTMPEKIARELCEYGIKHVGLTDGGRGSWIAWRDKNGRVKTLYCPTPNITPIVKVPHVTGAGDTWFGVFAYMLLAQKFDPIISGLLATQFATLKCTTEGDLGKIKENL